MSKAKTRITTKQRAARKRNIEIARRAKKVKYRGHTYHVMGEGAFGNKNLVKLSRTGRTGDSTFHAHKKDLKIKALKL